MQPDNSPKYLAAVTHLELTSECLFYCTHFSPRLMCILFISRANLDHE